MSRPGERLAHHSTLRPTYTGEVYEVSGTSPPQGDAGATSPSRELSKPRCAWAICSGLGRRLAGQPTAYAVAKLAVRRVGSRNSASSHMTRRSRRWESRCPIRRSYVQSLEASGPMLDSRRDRRYRLGAHRNIGIGLRKVTFRAVQGTSSGVLGFPLTRVCLGLSLALPQGGQPPSPVLHIHQC